MKWSPWQQCILFILAISHPCFANWWRWPTLHLRDKSSTTKGLPSRGQNGANEYRHAMNVIAQKLCSICYIILHVYDIYICKHICYTHIIFFSLLIFLLRFIFLSIIEVLSSFIWLGVWLYTFISIQRH